MATRLYLPSTGTCPLPEATVQAEMDALFAHWGGVNTVVTNFIYRPCYTTKQSTAMTSISHTASSTSGDLWYFGVWVSPPISNVVDITSPATWEFSVRWSESNALANFITAAEVILYRPGADGFGTSQCLLDNFWGAGEAATTLTSRHDAANTLNGTTDTAVGDRLFIYLMGTKNSTASYTVTVNVGDNSASDLTADDLDTGADNPWIECSANITFSAESEPSTNTNQLMMTGCGT